MMTQLKKNHLKAIFVLLILLFLFGSVFLQRTEAAAPTGSSPSGLSWNSYCKNQGFKSQGEINTCCRFISNVCINKCDTKMLEELYFDYITCQEDCDHAWEECAAVLHGEAQPPEKKYQNQPKVKQP